MRRGYYEKQTITETLAIGIKGNLGSLCGAMKRFARRGKQWNGLLTLKEQCARRIARIKNEQLKCFITGYLPRHLFKYVTKDIFNLQRDEFTSKYANDFDLCDICSVDTYVKPQRKCRCPKLETTIRKLNKHFFKQMNKKNTTKSNKLKQFELMYKLATDQEDYIDYDVPPSYFLYLSPTEHHGIFDMGHIDDDIIPCQCYNYINGQPSIDDKLLFVDAMRFLGAFHSEQEQPQLILSSLCETET